MMAAKRPLLFCAFLFLWGCIVPKTTPPPVDLSLFQTPDIQDFTLVLQVLDAEAQSVKGISIEIRSPELPTLTLKTNSQGRVKAPQLPLGREYAIFINDPDFLPLKRYLDLRHLKQLTEPEMSITLPLDAVVARISGEVRDPQDQPVANVVVYDGQNSVTTDETGTFHLSYPQATALNLSFHKQGYQSLSRPAELKAQQDLNWQLTLNEAERITIHVDTAKSPLGLNKLELMDQFTILEQTLSNYHWIWDVYDPKAEPLTDILWLLSPAKAYSETEIDTLVQFVQRGGKLVVTGEWAGFGGGDPEALNQLLARFGLQLGQDSLRLETPELAIHHFEPHPVTAELTSFRLFNSSSVQVTHAETGQILARTALDGYRIANQGAYGVLAVSLFGRGKIVLLGDSSCWMDQQSGHDTQRNIQVEDNLKLAQAVFGW